jgi:hypothetical protein
MEKIKTTEIINLYNKFIEIHGDDLERRKSVWVKQQQLFRDFWKRIMATKNHKIFTESDYDSIIKMIDIKARGFNRKVDVAVAQVGLYQGTWYRIFNDLVDQEPIKKALDKIFNLEDEEILIESLNELEKENEKNKNGLTGGRAVALNALLFINSPSLFVTSVSLKQRLQISEYFGFGDLSSYQTYGEQIIKSNKAIINGFRNLGINGDTITISSFLYSDELELFWRDDSKIINNQEIETEQEDVENIQIGTSESEFVLEKHLEDFLVANWESTELGKNYELIEEDEDLVSQQYPTNIGKIDLLVKEKKNGNYVVIELKRGQTNDDTVGQLARYMGWIKENKADGKEVKGIIIARGVDEKLKYALAMIENTEVLVYRLNFELSKI